MIEKFKAVCPGLLENEPMSRHTTFRIGGAADMFASVGSAAEAAELIRLAGSRGVPYTVMGNGSNMLVGDKGIRGIVISIGAGMSGCVISGTEVTAEAGILMSKLASKLLEAELTGFEPMSGIPGTLGGGIFMNAGAYGGEMKEIVKSVKYIDDAGELHEISGADCGFGYRTSVFAEGGKYIVSAALELRKGNHDEIKAAMAEYAARRSEKQPLSLPSAGSAFRRPKGHFAGKLIEDAGLRGFSVGGAAVSEKHAGFIVNKGGASAADVLALIEYVQKTVKEKFGVSLEPEVRLIGEN